MYILSIYIDKYSLFPYHWLYNSISIYEKYAWNMKCYVNLVICIVNPLFILSYGSHRITMQYFTRIYIDVNIKYVSIGHIIHFLHSKYVPKPWKYHVFLPYFLMSYHVYDGKYVYFNTYWCNISTHGLLK